jgi:hypothetical protein
MPEINHNLRAQVVTRLSSWVGRQCVLTSSELVERHGVIKEIAYVGEAADLQQSIDLSEFTVLLDSGESVRAPVSAIDYDRTP